MSKVQIFESMEHDDIFRLANCPASIETYLFGQSELIMFFLNISLDELDNGLLNYFM